MSAHADGVLPGEVGRLALQTPVAVRSVDVCVPAPTVVLPRSRSGAPYRGLAALLWRGSQPIGWAIIETGPDGQIDAAELERACSEHRGTQSWREEGDDGQVGRTRTTRKPDQQDCVTHVITTCGRSILVRRCVQAIVTSESGPFEIVVVENHPARSAMADVLRSAFPGDDRIRTVDEFVPGVSSARNAGLRAACGSIVTFTDDDILVDPHWCASVRRAFASDRNAACVTGAILPLELETQAQLLMERFAALGKGFERRVYSMSRPPRRVEQPLFPYTAGYFGSGGNCAFRRDSLLACGGFDPLLGIGTPTCGGEDLDVFVRLLLAGETIVYEPGFIAWHPHPDSMERLSKEVFAYGVGLGAMLSKHLLGGPQRRWLLRNAPGGVRYLFNRGSRKHASKGRGYSHGLDHLELVGLVVSPAAFAWSLWRRRWGGTVPERLCSLGDDADPLTAAEGSMCPGTCERKAVATTPPVHEAGSLEIGDAVGGGP